MVGTAAETGRREARGPPCKSRYHLPAGQPHCWKLTGRNEGGSHEGDLEQRVTNFPTKAGSINYSGNPLCGYLGCQGEPTPEGRDSLERTQGLCLPPGADPHGDPLNTCPKLRRSPYMGGHATLLCPHQFPAEIPVSPVI